MILLIYEVKHQFFILKFYFRPNTKEIKKTYCKLDIGKRCYRKNKKEFS